MAGHSKFKNIMHRKGAQDKKRASLFAKLTREIIVATKMGGSDPLSNHRLRLAIQSAKSQSMPKDNIDRAIKRGDGNSDTDKYEEIRYEGYGPSSVAVIVECLSDNRNRTASDVRTLFSKNSGSLGETGSVSFMFDRVGYIRYENVTITEDEMFEYAINAGADDIEKNDAGYDIYCASDQLHYVASALEKEISEASETKLLWKPKNTIDIDNADKARVFLNFLDALDDLDDVQNITTNADIKSHILDQIL